MSALAAGIGQAADGSSDVLRLVIVDDVEDLLVLLRLQFGRDPRFLVVGEGKDGHEAISLARDLQPDLMILDRQMPNLGGLMRCPRSGAPPRTRAKPIDELFRLVTAPSDRDR